MLRFSIFSYKRVPFRSLLQVLNWGVHKKISLHDILRLLAASVKQDHLYASHDLTGSHKHCNALCMIETNMTENTGTHTTSSYMYASTSVLT